MNLNLQGDSQKVDRACFVLRLALQDYRIRPDEILSNRVNPVSGSSRKSPR
jgi:hypothetical protein